MRDRDTLQKHEISSGYLSLKIERSGLPRVICNLSETVNCNVPVDCKDGVMTMWFYMKSVCDDYP